MCIETLRRKISGLVKSDNSLKILLGSRSWIQQVCMPVTMPMNHPKPLRRDRNFNAAPHGPRTESTGRMSKCKTTRDVVLHVAFDVAPDTEVQRVFVSLITSLSARARPENDCPCHSPVSWTAPRADRRSKLSGVACHLSICHSV